MKKILILLLILPTLLMADAVIFSGNDVKTLKPNIDLFGKAKILTTSIDPSVAGLIAPIGSLAMNTVTGVHYLKTSAPNTGWTKDQTGPVNLTTDVTGVLPVANGGTGSATQNFVDLTSPQTIGGVKTFSSTIVGDISGNAATVTTNANLTGDVTSIGNATTYNNVVPVAKGGTNSSAALTNSKAMHSVAGAIVESAVTSTELGYLSGTTSAIQTQIDSKVTGPASATDNAITRYDATTGKLVQDSLATVGDTGTVSADDYAYTDAGFSTISQKESLAVVGSTGVMAGGIISIGTPNTTVTVSNGNGYCSSNTGTNSLKKISWTGLANQSLTFLATNIITYLAIDCSNSALAQSITPFTNTQSRDFIILGAAVHSNLTIVNAVNQLQQATISPLNQLGDLQRSLGFFNVDGDVYSANGANLNLNRSSGHVHKEGSNWDVDTKNPNVKTIASATALTFRYRTQTGAEGSDVTAINPALYDLAGTLTAVPSARFSVQRISVFSSGLTRIQYGQEIYTSQSNAIAAIQIDPFITETNISQNGLLRGFLIVRGNATDLSASAQAFFLEAPKFGGTGGVGGLSTTTLQGAYNNSSTPQLTTDATLGALDLKRGSAADTDNVVRVLNGAGLGTAKVAGDGRFTSSYLDSNNMITNGDVELTDITMFTCGASNTCSRTTTSGEFSSGLAALKVVTAAAVLNVSQALATPSGIQKQGFLRISYKIPSAVADAQICTTVDSTEQTCTISGALLNNGLYNSIEIPLTYGATNVGWKAKTTATNTQSFFFDGVLIGQGLGRQALQGDTVYSAKVSSAGVTTDENKEFITGNCAVTGTSIYTCPLTAFTVTPTCVATSFDANSNNILQINSQSATSIVIQTDISTSGAVAARAFNLVCTKTGADYAAASSSAYLSSNGNYGWTLYTPTLGSFGTTNPTTNMCRHRRIGGDLEVACDLITTGTMTASLASITLPNSLTIDAARINVSNTTSASGQAVGKWVNAGAGNFGSTVTATGTSTALVYFGSTNGGTSMLIPTNGNAIITNAALSFNFRVPITGWSDSSLIVASFSGVPSVPGYEGKVETFSVSYGTTNATTVCSASPCSYLDQIGTAVTSITRTGTGTYSLNTTKTYLKLKCGGWARTASAIVALADYNCSNSNACAFQGVTVAASPANADSYGTIMCQGTY